MARDVGHLGGRGVLSEPGVEPLREPQDPFEQGPVHRFRLDRVGNAVPHDVAAADGLLELGCGLGRCLPQIGIDEPGAGRPDVALVTSLFAQAAGHLDGFGDVVVDVALLDLRTEVGESNVEVGLEDHEDLFDLRVGGLLRGGSEPEAPRQRCEKQDQDFFHGSSVGLFGSVLSGVLGRRALLSPVELRDGESVGAQCDGPAGTEFRADDGGLPDVVVADTLFGVRNGHRHRLLAHELRSLLR